MRKLDSDRSLHHFYEELVYTEAALSADPDAADLVPSFGAALDEWPGVFAREQGARRDLIRARARIAVADATLDRLTLRLGGTILLEAGQDRRNPLYTRFFPASPSELSRRPMRKQAKDVIDRVVPELVKLPATSSARDLGKPLAAAAENLLATLDERDAKRADLAGVSCDVDDWKESINKLRLATYGALAVLAADKGLSRGWADGFFRVESSRGASSTDDQPPADA